MAVLKKRVGIYRGLNGRWCQVLRKLLEARGHQVIGIKQPRFIAGMKFDVLFIWVGEAPHSKKAANVARRHGVEVRYYNGALLGQRQKILLSRHGSVGSRLFWGEAIPAVTHKDETVIRCHAASYGKWSHIRMRSRRRKEKRIPIMGMFQIEEDSAVQNYSPFKTMQSFADYVQMLYPDQPVIFKTHPKQNDIEIKGHQVMRSTRILDALARADLVVGMNSTSLYEATMLGIPIVPLAPSPLMSRPTERRAIIRELMRREIPLRSPGNCDDQIIRSIGDIV